ncbi:MAG: ABC transporter substrate-binding protein [Pseudomonadota bacterium]
MVRLATLGVLCALAAAQPVAAEVTEVKIAKQFSIGYLQINAMERLKLIEKHAKADGLGDVKVSWLTFNGPDMMNDALLSGSVDLVSGGVPGLVTLWAKTANTRQAVKGISALSAQPILLNARNPDVRTIADFTDKDRIALPAVKVSVQAVTLQMAAAKQFGQANFAKLDPLTVSMSPPDSTIALLSGSADITAVFGVPPFQQEQLKNPKIHTVLNSADVLGPHSFTCLWTSAKFHDENPKLYKSIMGALTEATEFLNKDIRTAGSYWLDEAKSKLSLDEVAAIVSGPQGRMDNGAEKHHGLCRVHACGRIDQGQADALAGHVLPRDRRHERQLTASPEPHTLPIGPWEPLRLHPHLTSLRGAWRRRNPEQASHGPGLLRLRLDDYYPRREWQTVSDLAGHRANRRGWLVTRPVCLYPRRP